MLVYVLLDDDGDGPWPAITSTPAAEPTTTDEETQWETPSPAPTTTGSDDPSSNYEPRDRRQELLNEQRRLLRKGTIAYRAPEPMRVGEAQRVTVRVTDGTASPSPSELPGTGRPTIDPAMVGPDVKAALTGPDFDIERVGEDDGRRALVTDGHVEWAWDVRPQRSGHLRLEITLYVLLNDGSTPIEVRTYDRSVEVEVDTWREVTGWLKEWLPYTGLTIPVLAGGTLALIARRRAKARNAPAHANRNRSRADVLPHGHGTGHPRTVAGDNRADERAVARSPVARRSCGSTARVVAAERFRRRVSARHRPRSKRSGDPLPARSWIRLSRVLTRLGGKPIIISIVAIRSARPPLAKDRRLDASIPGHASIEPRSD